MQILLAFIVAIVLNAIATILLKLGSAKIHFSFNVDAIRQILTNVQILGGIALYFASFPPYVYIFQKLNVSIAYPIFTSASFALTIIIAFIFLQERLTFLQILGLILVIGGIILLATNNATTA